MTVYWRTHDSSIIRRVCDYFGVALWMSVNRETEMSVDEKDMPMLEQVSALGYIDIRRKI